MRRISIVLFICLLSISVMVACQPTEPPATAVQPLPTLFASPTPSQLNLENAQRAVITFLDAWKNNDYETMYQNISFASREAISFEAFSQLYSDVLETMTFTDLDYSVKTLARDEFNPRVAQFTYDVTFTTRLFGSFDDVNRSLRILYDNKDQDWRIAWARSDIFAEFERDGRIRVETTSVNRANIYDRNGNVLASQEEKLIVTVSIVRRNIPDDAQCIETLSIATNLPIETIEARYYNFAEDWTNEIGVIEPQAYIKWQEDLVAHCNATFDNRPARRYHNGSLMPHIIGNVGYLEEAQIEALADQGFNQDSILGRNGVEASWDETLRGEPGMRLVIQTPDGLGRRILAEKPPTIAESLWLTIDSGLQQHILNLFAETYNANAQGWAETSKGAAAVVYSVNTGEILAMVSWPTYDANALTPFPAIGREAANEILEAIQEDERQPLLNRAAQGLYPTGSVMKVATSIAVTNSGVYETDHRYTCFGTGSFDRDIPRRDWLASGHGVLDLSGAITQSCNPYYYEAGYQMDIVDPWILPNQLNALGLGVPTGMTDIAENPGNIGNPDWKLVNRGIPWTFSDAVDMAIGQGLVEVNPLQVVRMIGAVANGGTLYVPHIVQKAGILNEFSYTAQPEVFSTVDIKEGILATVREGMCNVTTKSYGTAEFVFRNSALQDLGVCGKTGTAEDPPRLTHAWFAGYAPREKPEIAVVVVVENSGEGSGVAAPLVRDIMEYYFFNEESFAFND